MMKQTENNKLKFQDPVSFSYKKEIEDGKSFCMVCYIYYIHILFYLWTKSGAPTITQVNTNFEYGLCMSDFDFLCLTIDRKK